MIGLIQRVTSASVVISGQEYASINHGLLVLVAVENNDEQQNADHLFDKLINYRVFSDEKDKMNLSLKDTHGGLLLVPQFTLAANTKNGLRPSFTSAAPPEQGKQIFEYFCQHAKDSYEYVSTGVFGANMKVNLVNSGPVTFWLQV